MLLVRIPLYRLLFNTINICGGGENMRLDPNQSRHRSCINRYTDNQKGQTRIFYMYIYTHTQTYIHSSTVLANLGLVIAEVSRSHTIRHTTFGRTPLDEWSARHRGPYLTIHNTSKERDIHAPGWIRTHNRSNWVAAQPRLRLRGHRDRRINY
jgi:hypothetical protein